MIGILENDFKIFQSRCEKELQLEDIHLLLECPGNNPVNRHKDHDGSHQDDQKLKQVQQLLGETTGENHFFRKTSFM